MRGTFSLISDIDSGFYFRVRFGLFFKGGVVLKIRKSLNYLWFILLIFPLLLIGLSVFRTGTLDTSTITNDVISTIAFSPFQNVLLETLEVFSIVPTGYLLLVVNYFSYLMFMLLVQLIVKLFSWLFTLLGGSNAL